MSKRYLPPADPVLQGSKGHKLCKLIGFLGMGRCLTDKDIIRNNDTLAVGKACEFDLGGKLGIAGCIGCGIRSHGNLAGIKGIPITVCTKVCFLLIRQAVKAVAIFIDGLTLLDPFNIEGI
mgnify:CR=1 FL=1